jgi:hypothetical protein
MADDFTFRVATSANIAEVFADAPKSVLGFFKRGFRLLSTIGPEHYRRLIRTAAENLETGHLPGQTASQLAPAMKLSENEAISLLGTASFIVSVFTQRSEIPEDFIKSAEDAGVLEQQDIPAMRGFCEAVLSERDNLTVTVERARLGAQVLPSFEGLSITTDVRLGFKDDRVDLAIPVVVALLRTDSSKNLWFQLTKEQLSELISRLQVAMGNLEKAERWIGRGPGASV